MLIPGGTSNIASIFQLLNSQRDREMNYNDWENGPERYSLLAEAIKSEGVYLL
jgi:hypothetical protein